MEISFFFEKLTVVKEQRDGETIQNIAVESEQASV
jgi:hypothetical protein